MYRRSLLFDQVGDGVRVACFFGALINLAFRVAEDQQDDFIAAGNSSERKADTRVGARGRPDWNA